MAKIQLHVKKNRGTQLLSGNFYFKVDKSGHLVFFLATQIRTERPLIVLNSNLKMKVRLLAHQS